MPRSGDGEVLGLRGAWRQACGKSDRERCGDVAACAAEAAARPALKPCTQADWIGVLPGVPSPLDRGAGAGMLQLAGVRPLPEVLQPVDAESGHSGRREVSVVA